MGHHGVKIFDNRKKIDFKQTIINFQEKTISTTLIVTLLKIKHHANNNLITKSICLM